MDNDNKITMSKEIDDLHKQVMLFLGDEVDKIHQTADNQYYDMEKEYAKTKRNHSPVNFLVLFGAFLIVIGAVFFINKYISVKDEEITVSLDEFEDLNLSNLLNTVATAQMNYDNALKNKHSLEAEMESKLNNLKSDFDNEIFVLDSLNLRDRSEYRRRKNKAQSVYDTSVAEVKKEYEEEIILATKQVDAYKEQLDEFDSVKVANAQERERLLNSERQLRKIEIDKITKSYEARIDNLDKAIKNLRVQSSQEMRKAVNDVRTKYQAEIDALDPKLTDVKANLILSSVASTEDFNGPFKLVSANIEEPELVKSVKQYQDLYDDYKYLYDVIKGIPQKNSIPSYVAATRSLVNNMSATYIDSSMSYYNHIQNKNREISDLNTTIEQQKNKYDTDMAAAKTAHANQLKATSDSYERKLAATRNEGETSLSHVFRALGYDAVLLNAAGYENIQVAVDPAKKVNIPAEGISATIKSRPAIKGKLIADESGTYYFEVEVNADGTPKKVDFEKLVPGTIVEINL